MFDSFEILRETLHVWIHLFVVSIGLYQSSIKTVVHVEWCFWKLKIKTKILTYSIRNFRLISAKEENWPLNLKHVFMRS